MNLPLLSVDIRYEQDLVQTRRRARQIAGLLGFTAHDQTAFATAVSELARNAFKYAGHGRVSFSCRTDPAPAALVVEVRDNGPGIADLQTILAGGYTSQTGMGLGLVGAKRLSHAFEIQSAPGEGTRVVIARWLPGHAPAPTPQTVAAIAAQLAQRGGQDPLEEVQEQNKELMQTLDDLRERQAEVERLNTELAETNRGVVALYAELDEKAESLRQASEYKSRFLSDMTHELRTPLNAVVSLSRLLIDRVDGELTAEQEKQVRFIHRSASSLGEMVNDLLDLAKIEAGKIELQLSEVNVSDLLSALRGTFRPLAVNPRVALVVEEPRDVSPLCTDERKLSQILRNLVSNALKFTEHGEVRVTAEPGVGGGAVFSVRDTGIGIAPEHVELIFNDFTQIDSGVQRNVRGTGLGLPLTRKFANLLGGELTLDSTPGVGSTFRVRLPARGPPRESPEIENHETKGRSHA